MPSQLLSLALLPLALASLSPASPNNLAERQARHRALAARASNDVHPVLGKRSLEVRAGSGVKPGGFEVVGDSGVSAQMMFVGSAGVVYILDKTENNAMQFTTPSGAKRPAWGSWYDVNTNQATPMGVTSNTFCAGGMSTANGSWVVYGGNQPVTVNGSAVNDKWANPSGANPYGNTDGGEAIRLLNPCTDGSCTWQEGTAALTMTSKRWYPTIEALGDGTHIILGGDNNGGYVSTFAQNNPTYEFWPKKGAQIRMDFLNATVPMNLFPLTWLMPSGRLFLQAGYSTILYDIPSQTEIALPDMPYAQRIYPASGASVMLPLTPANNYEPTILFCGGSDVDLRNATDGGAKFNVTSFPADNTCVRITPEGDAVYQDDDNLPEGRSMGNLIYLPDGKLWLGNGVGMGTAGYGDEGWSVGQSYGQAPVYMPAVYDPNAPKGSRFDRTGLSASDHERMYHSTAVLLADGSLLVSGSNPNKDVTTAQWPTSYVVERWYPTWYNQQRPNATSAWPTTLTYGGDAWNLTYTGSASSDPSNTKVVVIRTGFSTHGMNFGQRYLELGVSFTQYKDTGDVTLHVSQMPPNANIFQPGPAMIFLVVDGIPSTGQMIMIGSGAMETQSLLAKTQLPGSTVMVSHDASSGSSAGNSASGGGKSSGTTTNAGSANAKSTSAARALRVSSAFQMGVGAVAGLMVACAGAAIF